MLYEGLITDLKRENGTNYDSFNTLKSECLDFFVNAFTAVDPPVKALYKQQHKITIDDTLEHSLFDSVQDLVIKANTLIAPKIIQVYFNGLFTTLSGASSTFTVKFGNTIIFNGNVSYLNNRTDYFIEGLYTFTVREIGINGKIILQGRDIILTSATQYTVALKESTLTQEVTIDTTVDNLLDILFKWNNAGCKLISSNGYILTF